MTPFTLKFAVKVTHPSFKQQNFEFQPIFAHSASTVRAGEKSSISANRKSTTRFPSSHRWTVYVTPNSPKGWHKTWFCCFSSKFQLLSKKSATKFLCVKTSRSKVVATSFLYLMVHRWIAGDVPIHQKCALKATHPFRKCWFRQISLNSATAMRASEKNSISTNRKSTTRFPLSHRWTLCVTLSPPKGGSKREFLHLALHFISLLQVIVDISNSICGLNIQVPAYGWQNVPEMSRNPF